MIPSMSASASSSASSSAKGGEQGGQTGGFSEGAWITETTGIGSNDATASGSTDMLLYFGAALAALWILNRK